MMEVLNACVGLKWMLNEPDWEKARTIRDEHRRGIRDLIAPDIFGAECGHALVKSQRRGLLSDAKKLDIDILMDSPRLISCVPFRDRALEIATNARISLFDCLYVALGEREGCELITSDETLMKKLQGDFPFIRSLASL